MPTPCIVSLTLAQVMKIQKLSTITQPMKVLSQMATPPDRRYGEIPVDPFRNLKQRHSRWVLPRRFA